jgi:GGDEF domain-containing protein
VQGVTAGRLLRGSQQGTRLDDADRALLATFAELASLALMDARTVEEMKEAFHDNLTGLWNRPLFLDRLTAALDRRGSVPRHGRSRGTLALESMSWLSSSSRALSLGSPCMLRIAQ